MLLPMIIGMNHFTAIAADPQAALHFYENLLGLKAGYRPDLGFAGAWLYAGETTVLHLYFDRQVPNPAAGVIDHIAFTTQDLKSFKARFDALGYPYKLQHREGGSWQLFCHDPSGAKIELNFSESESLD
jgi:catechol 2,3-dioxygenase-like lactoylglutathione lyase family enzyme